jgi:hypothetical protein
MVGLQNVPAKGGVRHQEYTLIRMCVLELKAESTTVCFGHIIIIIKLPDQAIAHVVLARVPCYVVFELKLAALVVVISRRLQEHPLTDMHLLRTYVCLSRVSSTSMAANQHLRLPLTWLLRSLFLLFSSSCRQAG